SEADGLLPDGGPQDRDRSVHRGRLIVWSMRARVHELWRVLLAEHRAPSEVAAAILVGALVGCTPLFGFHILICLALAFLLRLNKVIVYAAANLSMPPLVPLLGYASVQLG